MPIAQDEVQREGGMTAIGQGNVLAKTCPSRQILKDVTSRWGVLVLFALSERMHRFSELRRHISGISEKMLSQTLRRLEADGFVLRIAHPVIPPHVEYSLTESGQEIAVRLREIVDWIEGNIQDILSNQAVCHSSRKMK